MWDVLLLFWWIWVIILWSVIVAVVDNDDLPSWAKIIYFILLLMTLVWVLAKAVEYEEEDKLDCAKRDWEYRYVYKSSDECIKDGKIIKVY